MDRKSMEKKMRIFIALVIGAFLVLIARLVFLQLIETQQYQTMARLNHQRLITITAPRGEIVDRNGIRIVGNKPVYTISVAYLGSKDTSRVVGRLAQLLVGEDIYKGWSAGKIKEDINKKLQAQSLKLYEPIKVVVGVSYDTICRLEENRLDLPGVFIDIQPIRDYPLKDLLAQTVGFVREIDRRQLEKNKDNGYKPGDNFGQTGLESQYEYFLRGQDGGRVVEVDALGRPVRYLGVKSPVAGNKLVLTIDSRLQRVAQDALAQGAQMAKYLGYARIPAGKSINGAAVVLDVQTGEALAMASFPSYDPAMFTRTLSAKDYNKASSQGALKNHAIEDVYTPGSTFKMVSSAALLEGKFVTPLNKFFCTGFYKHKKDWKAHGEVDLRKALMYSCDDFFYHFGAIMGPGPMVKYAKEFGLGDKTGIDLPGEESGQIASPERKKEVWKDNAWESKWHEYDSMDMAIGQQENKFTALQLANYVAMIANDGKAMQPYLVQKIIGPDGKVVQQFFPNMTREVNISHETLEVIREGMHMVTLPPSGTACGVFAGAPYQAAAKTGTAEVGDPTGNTNALFVAFAPYDKPKIAVSVVLGYGGKGSGISGPVARQILDEFFKEQK